MKRLQLFPIIVTCLAIATSCSDDGNVNPGGSDIPPSDTIELSEEETDVIKKGAEFSFDLFRTAIENPDIANDPQTDNLAISPLSGNICLALIANSCDATTEQKIAQMLGASSKEDLNTVYNKLMRYLSSSTATGANIRFANSVWYADGHSVSPAFTEVIKAFYYADVTPIDFTDTPNAVSLINSWCAAKTDNLIPQFLDYIEPSTLAAWYNAIHFSGLWQDEFDPAKTVAEPFHGKDETSSVKMMHHEKLAAPCAEYDDFDAVKLCFKSKLESKTAITFILPHEGKDVDEVAAKLTSEFWSGLYFRVFNVNLSLPSFKIDAGVKYTQLLAAAGFNLDVAKLDQMGIADNKGVLNIAQKSCIKVDEKGAVVATVTGSDIWTANQVPSKTMTFNRPFIFIIENEATHSIILAGRINNLPKAE